jgi:hypothetical protein
MNGAFGLVGILVAGLILAYVWADHTQTVSKANKTIQPQLKQLAGQSPDGTPAVKSAKYAAVEANGALKVRLLGPPTQRHRPENRPVHRRRFNHSRF